MEHAGPTRRQAALDAALAIALLPFGALLAAVAAALLLPVEVQRSLAFVILVQAAVSIIGVQALLTWRSQAWSSIGLVRLRLADLARAAFLVATGFAANGLLTLAVHVVSPQIIVEHVRALRSLALALTTTLPLALVAALLLLVGFYEETVARGLLLARSRRLLGGRWPPVLLSALLFGLGHLYQGWFGAVQTAVLGLVLAAFTLRWATLWPAIVAHGAINVLSVLSLERVALAVS